MKEFGLINRLNGLDRLPYWADAPCNSIRASEGNTQKDNYSKLLLIIKTLAKYWFCLLLIFHWVPTTTN